jgi:dihydrofolate reductase
MTGEPAQRKLILYMSMSLDGFAAGRDGRMEWLGESQSHGHHRQRAVAELLGQTGLLVLGRRGAEDMALAWPSSRSATGELMNALPQVVFSSSLADIEWSNARVTDRPVEEEIPDLKDQPG